MGTHRAFKATKDGCSIRSGVAPALGLSASYLQAPLPMIGHAWPRAWTDPEEEPARYASQLELAAKLEPTWRAMHVNECGLSRALRLIGRRPAVSRPRSGAWTSISHS